MVRDSSSSRRGAPCSSFLESKNARAIRMEMVNETSSKPGIVPWISHTINLLLFCSTEQGSSPSQSPFLLPDIYEQHLGCIARLLSSRPFASSLPLATSARRNSRPRPECQRLSLRPPPRSSYDYLAALSPLAPAQRHRHQQHV